VSSSIPSLTRAQTARIRNLLQEKRERQAEGAFIVEGAKAVEDLFLTFPTHLQSVVMSVGYLQRESETHRRVRESITIPAYSCSEQTFSTISDLEAPQGILAVVRIPSWNEEEQLSRPMLFGLYGEQLQDPANVGAIIRTAAALNVSALWLTPDSADIYNPKVVRATSGALLSLPIFHVRDASIFRRNGWAIFAAQADGREAVRMETIKSIPQRAVLALGNESRGLSAETVQQAFCRFTIPLAPQVESLNVAASAAIALYYLGQLPKEP